MPVDASLLALGTLGLAALLVAVDALWKASSYVSTVVHEGGHTVALLLTGNWVAHIQFTPGAGGGTLPEKRKLFWPSDVLATSAGYTAPPLAGLLLARGVQVGWSPPVVLGVVLLLLVGVLLLHEDVYTLLILVAVGAVFAVALYLAGPVAQYGAVVVLAWFLLFAGLRDSLYSASLDHRNRKNGTTDQARLQDLTGVSAHVWALLFVFVALSALITGARWLLAA